MKQLIKLTENDLHKIVKASVNRILRESINNNDSALYRWIDLRGLINMLSSNSMKSTYHEGYNFNNSLNMTHNGICFTRDRKYKPYTEYEVQMVFSVQNLLNKVRGTKLIPYQDNRWNGLDEYEERLVSRDGKDFEIPNISQIVTAVYIHIDAIIDNIFEYGNSEDYEYVLKKIDFLLKNNIFKEKLQFLYDFKNVNIKNVNDFKDFVAKVAWKREIHS